MARPTGAIPRLTGHGAPTLRQLLLPTALLFAVATVSVGALLVDGADRLDRAVREGELRVAQSIVAGELVDLGTLARDYSWSDDAIANLAVDPDLEWADGNIGSYLSETYLIASSFVLAPDGATLLGFVDGDASDLAVGDYVEKGLAPLVAAAQAGSMAQPEPASGLVLAAGTVHFATVSPLTPEYPTQEQLEPQARPLLVLTRPVASALDAAHASAMGLEGFAVTTGPVADDRRWSVPLVAADGTELGNLSWRRDRPGGELLGQLALPLAIALLAGVAMLWLAVRNAGAVVRHDLSLRTLLERERELRELRSRFVSTVSHKFRTPLATIQAASDLISRYHGRMDEAGIVAETAAIARAVEELELLLDKTTAIDQAETSPPSGAAERLDVARRILTLWQNEFGNGRGGVSLEVSGDVRIVSDAMLFDLVMSNLLDNAVRYSNAGDMVKVRVSAPERERVRIVVADEGIGMPASEIEHAAEPFTRGSNVGERAGTGIGLAVVRHALARLGGTMRMESEVGAGTVVTVELPADASMWARRTEWAA